MGCQPSAVKGSLSLHSGSKQMPSPGSMSHGLDTHTGARAQPRGGWTGGLPSCSNEPAETGRNCRQRVRRRAHMNGTGLNPYAAMSLAAITYDGSGAEPDAVGV